MLQKSFWGGERKFLEPLMRFTRGEARAVRSQPPVAKQIAARGPPVRWRGLRAVPVALRSRRALRPRRRRG